MGHFGHFQILPNKFRKKKSPPASIFSWSPGKFPSHQGPNPTKQQEVESVMWAKQKTRSSPWSFKVSITNPFQAEGDYSMFTCMNALDLW